MGENRALVRIAEIVEKVNFDRMACRSKHDELRRKCRVGGQELRDERQKEHGRLNIERLDDDPVSEHFMHGCR
jgi:hypothetical protein